MVLSIPVSKIHILCEKKIVKYSPTQMQIGPILISFCFVILNTSKRLDEFTNLTCKELIIQISKLEVNSKDQSVVMSKTKDNTVKQLKSKSSKDSDISLLFKSYQYLE